MFVSVRNSVNKYTCLRSAEVSLSGKILAILLQYLQGNTVLLNIYFFMIILQLMPLKFSDSDHLFKYNLNILISDVLCFLGVYIGYVCTPHWKN